MTKEKLNNVLVTRPDMAQWLLNQGYTIVSIARNRYEPARTVYYFRPQDGLMEDIKEFAAEHAIGFIY